MTSPTPVLSLLCGPVQAFRKPDEPSAIAKTPIDGPVRVHRLGLAGDEQADLTVHGGPDKAIHHYPHDHYAFWRTQIGDHPLLDQYGAFGENIATHGMTEDVEVGGGEVLFRLGGQRRWPQRHVREFLRKKNILFQNARRQRGRRIGQWAKIPRFLIKV